MEFQVNDMSCGACVRSITSAVQQLDPAATVAADLAQHSVTVQSGRTPQQVLHAISEAGYDAVLKA